MKFRKLLAFSAVVGLAAAFPAHSGSAATKKTTKTTKTTKSTKKTTAKATAAPAAAPTAAPTTAPAAGSAPFKVMVIGDFTSAIGFPVSESIAAAKVALKDTPNATIVTCDSKTDPNAAQACAREAVSQKVAAVILAFSPLAQDQSILAKEGIPVLGQTDMTSPVSFAFANGTAAYTGMGVGFIKQGCRSLGVIYFEGTDFLVDGINAGAKSLGGEVGARAAIDPRNPDFAPAVAKLGATDCIALSVAPPMVPAAVLAINQSGIKVKMGGVGALFPAPIVKALGANAEGIMIFESQVNADDAQSSFVKQFRTDLAAVDGKATVTQQATLTWAAARGVAKAASTIKGPIDAASLLPALNAIKSLDLQGALAPLDFDGQKATAFKRLINPKLSIYVIKSGLPTKLTDFFDFSAALK
jgi:hypothetical protein